MTKAKIYPKAFFGKVFEWDNSEQEHKILAQWNLLGYKMGRFEALVLNSVLVCEIFIIINS